MRRHAVSDPDQADLRHAAQIRSRLRRIEGQVKGINEMYDEGRPCIEILDQVAAARAALEAVGVVILDDHVNRCFEPVIDNNRAEAGAAQLLTAVRRFVRSA